MGPLGVGPAWAAEGCPGGAACASSRPRTATASYGGRHGRRDRSEGHEHHIRRDLVSLHLDGLDGTPFITVH